MTTAADHPFYPVIDVEKPDLTGFTNDDRRDYLLGLAHAANAATGNGPRLDRIPPKSWAARKYIAKLIANEMNRLFASYPTTQQ